MTFSFAYSLKSEEVTLTNCDREPVHVPGCIQPFGVLLALDPATLEVLQVSDNAKTWLGADPGELARRFAKDVFGEEPSASLAEMLVRGEVLSRPRFAFSCEREGRSLDVLAHLHDGILILEAEEATDAPARERAFLQVDRITSMLRQAPDLRDFCQSLATEIRALTGLDRVMVYRFHEDLSGEVFAEAKRDDLHGYFGLHYPSEDIPQPAREIFRKIWVRPLPSVDYVQSELVPLINPRTNRPLDMTYCFLRGASVMYTDYLKNMGVAMAFTLSLVVDGKLWGLVACHHYATKVIPWPLRSVCELLAQMVSLQLTAVQRREDESYRARMESTVSDIVENLLADGRNIYELLGDANSLAQYMNADGIAVYEAGKWHTRGVVPNDGMLTILADWVREAFNQAPLGTEVLHTHALSERFPGAASIAALASGVLAIPVSRRYEEMIIWFRREVVQTVNWAGDPYSKRIVDGPGGERLLPRSSFETWQEQVRGQSLPWKPVEIEAARRLRLAVMEVVAARTESIRRLNRELAASNEELDAFAYVTSHDLREPLRGIYHYAHHLQEEARQRTDDDSLGKTQSLLRLTKRMDGLIESLLHYSRLGRTSLNADTVDMRELVDECIDIARASRANKKPDIRIVSELPHVRGDAMRLREVWMNLVGNAIKYNDSMMPVVEIGYKIDTKGGHFFVRDNGIGIAEENRETVFHMFKRLHGKDDYGGGSGAGLPIVRKIVERHGGRVWIESEAGSGSAFCFTVSDVA